MLEDLSGICSFPDAVLLLDPTLSDLAGLTLPAPNDGGEFLGGTSLKPVFDNPDSSVGGGKGGVMR